MKRPRVKLRVLLWLVAITAVFLTGIRRWWWEPREVARRAEEAHARLEALRAEARQGRFLMIGGQLAPPTDPRNGLQLLRDASAAHDRTR
jgi:hypothetical protein